MRFEIINIGDELLIGQVVNTNAAWLGTEILSRGWDVSQTVVIADQKQAILSALDEACQRADVVLMTGGIGPTKDDITKHTLAEYFNVDLRFDKAVLENIEKLFAHRQFALNELTRSQAWVPTNAVIIQNEVGTAPCCWFNHNGCIVVSLPGVPSEMKWLMEEGVFPRLQELDGETSIISMSTLLVMNYTESALAEKLSPLEDLFPENASLAYLPQPGMIRLRLTIRGSKQEDVDDQREELLSQFRDLLQSDLFFEQDLPIAAVLLEKLKEQGLSLATAESCTGGKIASMITAIAGSSEVFQGSVVSYANEVKQHVLGVQSTTLEEKGAVSEEVVRQMVEGVSKVCMADCAIATSGIAGPSGGTIDKPVGTVWVAVKVKDKITTRCFRFGNIRQYNIDRAVNAAMLMMISCLEKF